MSRSHLPRRAIQLNLFHRASKVALLSLLLGVAACGPQAPLATPQPSLTSLVEESPSPVIESPTPIPPTPVVLEESQIQANIAQAGSFAVEEVLEEGILPPSPAPDPLRFVFPTPAPAPVSAWRPPLYPAPWVPTTNDHFYFSRPIAADEINWPLADYRYGGVFLPDVVHTGIDIPAPLDTPVLAAGSGRVTWAGYGLYRGVVDTTDPYGLAVAIKHDFGFQGETLFTVYGHLSRVDVLVGQQVSTGDILGLVGQTGQVTGPHLHFEVRVGRNNYFLSRNPELWLTPPIGWGVLAARILDSNAEPLIGQTVSVYSKTSGQSWYVITYGQDTANSDTYYRENMVLGDLPAGEYTIWIPFQGSTYDLEITISPGLVSYFTFRGRSGFKTGLPPTPGVDFTPPAPTLTPNP